ncbi:KPN_02809 family neutral zinc metallopeptidase [Azotobacter salinestris]|uniref:KPN_02809 family neutral zinc metallopeptidase n=1 Tax=Azotobacter salinestris TaxID=69964 RepID=UPI001266D26A|nr:neutral zinc metallopeptidase [Azotobacter salinestris]
MRWKRARRSDNVVDARGGGLHIGGKGLGLGGIALVVIVGLLMGQDPGQILTELTTQSSVDSQQAGAPPAGDEQAEFVRAVLGDTEDTWRALFEQAGREYRAPALVLFSQGVNSACGFASQAVGPFYCPADQRVYLDLAFFDELARRFAASGDFAQAYVIAHEIGHHVQALLGVSSRVSAARQRGERLEGASGLLVRQELQADCLAGVWAHHAQRRLDWLEPGDLEEALSAANAIGDDRLQRHGRGQVVPDSFTHGTSEQRVRWFRMGFESGEAGRCDTFQASRL